ncbi:dihydrolipoamide acetyltransferase family protein [Sporosarcina sp. G11-34]|uniref:dihydrolipoamide acetyltransferase family protein n=1 Tax=Sporosarcina sp. G11-34 TaxID=2849605 RepID=UPI0022A9373D|nr:dihydrolipoamide acetyltransferase family protein [Sporosarcina sp. G11-34]MCZ2260868.1 2-oxo acid dehydrogenase subunit E2 [Sporosarcina sp. G11-34]
MLEVKLHDIGEGMSEGEIVQYFVKVGDRVVADQPLVEVLTDKMTAELPSPCSGTVKEIIINIGETVQVGTSLIYIVEDDNTQSVKKRPKEELPTATKSKEKPSITLFNRVLAAPYTRKIARDNNINIEDIVPTDPSGRVSEKDVHRFIKEGKIGKESMIDVPKVKEKEASNEIPFLGIRKQIAEKMTKSFFTIPHVTHFDEVNMTNLLKIREDLKNAGESITIPAFFIKALVISLKEFPIFNAELDEENNRIILKKNYHIGFATNTANGLLVPVVFDADQKSIKEIHQEVKGLTEKALAGKLKPSEMQHSTFTMSNVGPLGSTGATPIINHPETAIISFHKTRKRPIVNEDDEIVIGHVMTISMSFDHRVADGSTAVAFTNCFASLIEQPYKLMMELI